MRSVLWAILALSIMALVGCAGASGSYAGADYSVDRYVESKAAPQGALDLAGGALDDGLAMEMDEIEEEPSEISASPSAQPSEPADQDKDPNQVPVPKKRLVIYRADLGLFVFDMEDTLTKAEAIGEKYKGWVQQSTSTSLTLRVPAEQFEATMADLEALGDVNFRNVVGTDVTEQFYDTQIRLKNAEVLRDRYIELLRQARTVEDSLAIERELARVTQDIELLKGKLRFLGNQIAFSTINLSLQRKTQEPVKNTHVHLPFGWMGQYNLDSVLR